MKLINEKTLNTSLKKIGFEKVDDKAHKLMNSCLHNFTLNVLDKAVRVAKKENSKVIAAKHVVVVLDGKKSQAGGAETTMPLEYFGVRTNFYSENAPKGYDMSVSESAIRPAFSVNDPKGFFLEKYSSTEGLYSDMNPDKGQFMAQEGGAQFSVPLSAVQEACKLYMEEQNNEVKVNSTAQKALKQKFENVFSEVLNKAAKKDTSKLSASVLESILQQRKFQKLFKH